MTGHLSVELTLEEVMHVVREVGFIVKVTSFFFEFHSDIDVERRDEKMQLYE